MVISFVVKLAWRYRLATVLTSICLLLELQWHRSRFNVSRPAQSLDTPFQVGCQQPPTDISPEHRQDAVIVMLARDSDVDGAVSSILSLEERFNRWWHYPVMFLTEERRGWSQEFQTALTAVASGEVSFETIPESVWSYPEWIDQTRAKEAAKDEEARGLKYGGSEDYHHMCRFYSGNFYHHPALSRYKWYWRVEPGIEYTCAITYDPFAAMAARNKTYGYTIALWELSETVPSLFSQTSAYKDSRKIPTTNLWRNMVDPSWAPYGMRKVIPSDTQRDRHGDAWNLCHYWSNFEIADLDFFRSPAYQDYFKALDRAGGFYYERWGDAPVHTLGAALFLQPEQLHFFADLGYRHAPYQWCPRNAAGRQMHDSDSFPVEGTIWPKDYEDGVGCRCLCDPDYPTNRPICRNKLRAGVE